MLSDSARIAIINLVSVIDPEIVVLRGCLSELPHAQELFVLPIEQLTSRHSSDTPRIRLPHLQDSTALYEAMQAAIGVVLNVAGRSEND